jgi:Zn-dependent alcohol dehydrogenase
MIRDHIKAVQQEILEKYGVKACIEVKVYNVSQEVDLDKATEITCGIQPAIGAEIKIDHSANYKWLSCYNQEDKIEFCVWYGGE